MSSVFNLDVRSISFYDHDPTLVNCYNGRLFSHEDYEVFSSSRTPWIGGRVPRSNSSGRRKKSVTITDVALQAGVSRAHAARVLGNYGYVSAVVRTKVLSAAQELGYTPNALARSVRTRRTHTIGVVVGDIENPFFSTSVRGIADAAHENGYEIILTNSDEDLRSEERAVQTLVEGRVAGLLIAPAAANKFAHLQAARTAGIPVVLFDRVVNTGTPLFDYVIIDSVEAARTATEYLIDRGHTRIALVTSSVLPPDIDGIGISDRILELTQEDAVQACLNPDLTRALGYLQALGRHGIRPDPNLLCMNVKGRHQACEAVEHLWTLPNRPTAIFTTANTMSLGAFEAINRANLVIPDDISFIGIDDLDWASAVRPQLTAVAQPIYKLGKKAVGMLLSRILTTDEDPPHGEVLPARLVVRESVADLL